MSGLGARSPAQTDFKGELSTIDFHGQVLQIVHTDGRPYVPVKTICVNLGIDWEAQGQRISRDTVLSEGACMIQAPSPGGMQDMLCLPLEYLNGWLFGIDEKRVAPGIRDALVTYKREAYGVLYDYFIKGYALNERRLRDNPETLRELAAKLRALRADERNIYQNVRDAFAFGSVDYDKDSSAVRSFYARLQDRFLHAATGQTAAELILTRADHRKPVMGLTVIRGILPERTDVGVGKNYLVENELYGLHILCEQFLLYLESKAIRGQTVTMAELAAKFEDLLRVQGHAPFPEYGEFIAQKARSHAQREFDLWRVRVRHLPREERCLA